MAGIIAGLVLAASSSRAQEPVDAATFDWSGTVTPGGTVRLDGTVTVYVPASFAGDVDARTSDGRIDSEVSLPISGRVDPKHVRATVGTNGVGRLDIDSSDGDIHLKRL
jgi:hypothetical protein